MRGCLRCEGWGTYMQEDCHCVTGEPYLIRTRFLCGHYETEQAASLEDEAEKRRTGAMVSCIRCLVARAFPDALFLRK